MAMSKTTLLLAGVKPEVWKEWMTRLHTEMMGSTINITTALILIVSVWGIPYCMYKNNQKQTLALKFENDINAAVFHPLGLHFKFQTGHVYIDDNYQEDLHWMAISLNAEDAAKLKAEEHNKYLNCFDGQFFECGDCDRVTDWVCCCGVRQIL